MKEAADRSRQPGPGVVLVEDDAGLREALARLLDAAGFEAHAFATAEAALADEQSTAAECLVIDVNLPVLSGFELVDRLRARGASAPVILISAHDEARIRREADRRAIAHFLAKPFPGRDLVALLNRAIGDARADLGRSSTHRPATPGSA